MDNRLSIETSRGQRRVGLLFKSTALTPQKKLIAASAYLCVATIFLSKKFQKPIEMSMTFDKMTFGQMIFINIK